MNHAYLYLDNQVVGPYPESELRQMLAEGKVQQETLCNDGTSGEWLRLGEFLAGGNASLGVSSSSAARVLSVTDAHSAVIACPFCNQEYEIDPAIHQGSEVSCDSCHKHFRVPEKLSLSGAVGAVPALGNTSSVWADYAREVPNGNLLCPHCWKSFDSDNLLYIATHPTLVGDPLLGDFAQKRFVPTVFNDIGQPLDECGLAATDTACPRCHLPYPQGMIDNPALYFSIAGATSSGKSYFLTCLVHLLRRLLPKAFNAAFYDVNPRMNQTLCGYEKELFMAENPDKVVALPATQISGDGYSNRVLLNNVEIELPKPFVFGFRPAGKSAQETNLVFYDNSGEMFVPGRDEWINQATFHLSHANGIVFLFDPTNDANMRRSICDTADPQVSLHPRSVDQLVLLHELISRIRRHSNMANGELCRIPLVVALGKYDVWREHFDRNLAEISPIVSDGENLEGNLDMDAVADISFAARELMSRQMPELVETAERFFQQVYFVPVSSFGTHAEVGEDGKAVGVVPSKMSPIWLEVPALVLMASNGLVKSAAPRRIGADLSSEMPKVRWQEGQLVFPHPVTGEAVRLPANYGGHRISIAGKAYLLPKAPGFESSRLESNPWK